MSSYFTSVSDDMLVSNDLCAAKVRKKMYMCKKYVVLFTFSIEAQ